MKKGKMKGQMVRGFRKALAHTDKSKRAVSLDAGFNENLLGEYMRGENRDIQFMTVEKLCEEGLGMSFNEVWILGQMK